MDKQLTKQLDVESPWLSVSDSGVGSQSLYVVVPRIVDEAQTMVGEQAGEQSV